MLFSLLQLEEKRDVRALAVHFFGQIHRLVRRHELVRGAMLQPQARHTRMNPVCRAGEVECLWVIQSVGEENSHDRVRTQMAVFFRLYVQVDRVAVRWRIEDDEVLHGGIQTGKAELFIRKQSRLQCEMTACRFAPECQVICI